MITRGTFVSLAVGIVLLGPTAAYSQAPQPEPPKNLQVLPKDIPRPQLTATMQAFAAGLGVQCTFCHVREEGKPTDFAADGKPEKKAARVMMRMVNDVNARLSGDLGKPPDALVQVRCATCHHGQSKPRMIQDVLAEDLKTGGADAALAKYRDLRTRYYGSYVYDFSDGALIDVARGAMRDKPEDALKLLQANLEFFPRSGRIYVAIADVCERKADKASAIQALEKAVELDPANAQAKARLDTLKKGSAQ